MFWQHRRYSNEKPNGEGAKKKQVRGCDLKGEVGTGRHASSALKTVIAGHLLREHRSPVSLPVESRRPVTFQQGDERRDRLLMRPR